MLRSGFEKFRYVRSANNQKGRMLFKYHYYKYSSNIFIVIRKLLSNKKYQFYSVVDKIKILIARTPQIYLCLAYSISIVYCKYTIFLNQ